MTTLETLPSLAKKPVINKSLVLFLLVFFGVGTIVTFVVIYAGNIGLFEGWHFFSRVPPNTVEVTGGNNSLSYIRTDDNKLLSCTAERKDQGCIPDVDLTYSSMHTEKCNYWSVAFLPNKNAPKNIVSCIQIRGRYLEIGYKVIYALDRDHNLWQWVVSNSAYELFFIPIAVVFGGLIGTLVGSIFWVIKQLANKNRTLATPLFPRPDAMILVIPWLCLLSGTFLYVFLFCWPDYPSDPDVDPDFAEAWTEIAAAETMEAQKWWVIATPSGVNPRFDFTQDICAAEWKAGFNSVVCLESSDSTDFIVSKLSNPSIEEIQRAGDAIWIRVTPNHKYIVGEFPTMEIEAGDHFKAEIGCLDQPSVCDILFELTCETQDIWRIDLGRWQLSDDHEMDEIDVDLSSLAGKKVRFSLSIYDEKDLKKRHQNLVWLRPRIEK